MENKEQNPRQLTAADVEVGVLRVTDQGTRLRLWAKPERVRAILDELYQPDGWSLQFTTVAGKMCCALAASCMDDVGDIRAIARAAMCPSEYRMCSDQARNEMNGSLIMAASFMGIGASVMELPSIPFRNNEVQINPVPDASGKRIARYDLADTLTPTNLVYDASGHIVEVDFTRRNGGVIKWQKR